MCPAPPSTSTEATVGRGAGLTRTDAVVWLLNDDAVPMSPKHLTRRLRGLGRNDTLDTVGTTVYDLWRGGRIARLGRGVYCANEHIPEGMVPIMSPTA